MNADRLRTLARINQFHVTVRQLELKADMADAVQDYNSEAAAAASAVAAKKKDVGRHCRKAAAASKAGSSLSYFVSYSVPPEAATQNFCSSKKGPKQPSKKPSSKTVQPFDSANSAHHVR